ncbi:Uncharacterized protein HZ326_22866 [Fusarium oxysporum f. sp. albedinis]|nr:Uncharacterized protein HZ326_22866 [Fusarium oxysporum f. sp. albedinis]
MNGVDMPSHVATSGDGVSWNYDRSRRRVKEHALELWTAPQHLQEIPTIQGRVLGGCHKQRLRVLKARMYRTCTTQQICHTRVRESAFLGPLAATTLLTSILSYHTQLTFIHGSRPTIPQVIILALVHDRNHHFQSSYVSTDLARAKTKAMHSPFNIQSPPAPDTPQSQTGQDTAARTENGTVPPRKRQKIDLACEECRTRKVRCDGLRPECSACKRRENACIYLPEFSKLSGSRRYVPLWGPAFQEESKPLMSSTSVLHSLNDRVAYLEAKANGEASPKTLADNPPSSAGLEERLLLKQSSQAVNAGPSPSQSQQCDTDSIVVKPKQTLPRSSAVLSTRSSSEDATTDVDSLSPDQGLGAIGAMGMALSTTETPTDTAREFYGKPSAASLLCDIQNHGQRPSKSRSSKLDSASQPSPPSSRRSLSVPYSSNTDDYHLPPRHVADSLLDIYRERVQIIYPFLHWQTFMEAYNRLWLSDSEVKSMPQLTGVGLGGPRCPVPVFYCALNAAFALATQFTDGSAQERKERSAPFVRRSRHLMRLDFLDATDISMVQALLILARYLQSTSLPTRCWNVVGIAYRMAQGLGLHIAVNERSTSELELEVRRRVWHSCVSLDTYDKPPSCILLPTFLTSLFCTES